MEIRRYHLIKIEINFKKSNKKNKFKIKLIIYQKIKKKVTKRLK